MIGRSDIDAAEAEADKANIHEVGLVDVGVDEDALTRYTVERIGRGEFDVLALAEKTDPRKIAGAFLMEGFVLGVIAERKSHDEAA